MKNEKLFFYYTKFIEIIENPWYIILVAPRLRRAGKMDWRKRRTLKTRKNDMRLFIYCSDPREEANLELKIQHKLLYSPNERIVRLADYGYPMVLAHPIAFNHGANWLMEQISFTIRKFRPEQVVSIGHDCGWYEESVFTSGISLSEKKRDILRIHKMLLRRHPDQDIKSFFDASAGNYFDFESLAC